MLPRPTSHQNVYQGVDALVNALENLFQGTAIRFGKGTVAWPGGVPTCTDKTITHNLGLTPTAVLATATKAAGNGGSSTVITVGNFTSTTFDVSMRDSDKVNVANGSPGDFYWIAIA